MNYLLENNNLENETTDKYLRSFITNIKTYLHSKVITANRLTSMVIFDGPSKRYKEVVEDNTDNGNLNIFVLKEAEQKWVPAESEDKRDLERAIIEHYELTKDVKDNMNKFVGFVGFETNQKDMVFKIKDTANKRSTGFRCIQAGKGKKIIDILNEIEGFKQQEERFAVKESKESVYELCIRIELTLRSYEYEKLDDVLWFIDTETAIFNEFEKREKPSK
jgi:type IV secretory pathway ATPase VirB11/archaellum biosynthesis ATPase